jgi:aldehyde oxidoreductase
MKITRLMLTINGVDRPVICDPEKDTLAIVLRRMGLTGTKIGCGIGVCGACSVILNGEVIRSCTRKMKNVPEFSSILTMKASYAAASSSSAAGVDHYGGCSAVSARRLYRIRVRAAAAEPEPTLEKARDCFSRQEICRCTGYKPIIDAVMAAEKVMRPKPILRISTYDFTLKRTLRSRLRGHRSQGQGLPTTAMI